MDFASGVLTIDSTVTKGDDGVQVRPRTKTKKPRRVAVSSMTLAYLTAHKQRVEALLSQVAGEPTTAAPDELVFSGGYGSRRTPTEGKPWRPDSTTRRFRRLTDLAGVRADIDLHGLRHTMISEMLAAGVDPAR